MKQKIEKNKEVKLANKHRLFFTTLAEVKEE